MPKPASGTKVSSYNMFNSNNNDEKKLFEMAFQNKKNQRI